MKSVYSAVRTEPLNKSGLRFVFKGVKWKTKFYTIMK
jgi:hypothetical protein